MSMRCIVRRSAIALAGVCVPLLAVPATAQTVDNDANALILANRAKILAESREQLSREVRSQQRRALQGSALGTLGREAGCGGVAIGNVRPVLGDHRQHETTVVILGNIINSGNEC